MTQIPPDQPIRLGLAAQLSFPDGTMGVSGLRKEAERGHLVIEKIAGRYYTTLANIQVMRERCQHAPKARAFTSAPPAAPAALTGSSSTMDMKAAQAAASTIVQALKQN